MKRLFDVLRVVLGAAFVLVVVPFVLFINSEAIDEAYGNGAPYYDRTTNMDKWADPLPVLIPIDLVVFALGAWGLMRLRRP